MPSCRQHLRREIRRDFQSHAETSGADPEARIYVRIEAPGIRPSIDDSTTVGEIEETIDPGPDGIHHVSGFFGMGLLAKLHEKVIEIPCDAYGYMQIFSDLLFLKESLGARHD